MLTPTTDGLLQHLKQSNYWAFVWSNALEAMQDLESLEEHGWTKDKEFLVPLPITQAPAPVLAFSSRQCGNARHMSDSKTAPAATQDLLTQKDASAWQTTKHVGNHMLWPVSVTQKKATKRVALKRNCKIVDI